MTTPSRFVVPLILILASALPAWQQDSHSHRRAPAGPEWPEFSETMEKMHSAMASVEPSGNTDLDFVKLMLPHHQAAIDMAKTQLLYGKDQQLRRLAQEIITDQQSEIELMKLWLKQNQPGSQK